MSGLWPEDVVTEGAVEGLVGQRPEVRGPDGGELGRGEVTAASLVDGQVSVTLRLPEGTSLPDDTPGAFSLAPPRQAKGWPPADLETKTPRP